MNETVRILIVDDAEINREMLKLMLAGEGVAFEEAGDGEEAIELLKAAQQDPYDLMLLDINMPSVDGFGVLEYVHDNHLAEDMPIIMISAENTTDFMDRAYDLGATDYIPRPFDANIVQRRVRNTLELYRKQRSIARQLRDANMRYMDTVKRMRADIILYIHMDLERDTYRGIEDTQHYLQHFKYDGTINDLIATLTEMIPEPDVRAKAQELLSRENILRSHAAGQDTLALEHDFIMADGRRLKLATTVGIVTNPVDGSLEAILYSVDISKAYVKRRMQSLLYENVYDGIATINVRTGVLSAYSAVESTATIAFSKRYDSMSYDDCLARGAKEVVLEQDVEFFLQNAALDNICRELEEKDSFFFTVRAKTTAGKRNRYAFRYLDDARETIVLTVEDCTKSSETDDLTGGLNRSGFENAVAMKLAAEEIVSGRYAILYVDIRSFRAVNDLFGREMGDIALRQFEKGLEDSALCPLTVARIEGDQFLCLVDTDNIEDGKLRGALSQTIKLEGNKTVDVRSRCGIYVIDIEGGMTINSMCDCAAAALSSIENEHATPYAAFNVKMRDSYLDREKLLSHIDAAIDNEEFIPYYQPIVDAKTHELVSAEALVRWISPELGMVSPGSFIPALERSGRISQVDLMIARSVQHMLESRSGEDKRIVPVSTNLSRMDFYDREMMSALLDGIANASISASYLRKELTESSYVSFTESQGDALGKLVKLGVPILLDDFGTGASSFSTVRDYDFSIIKIDMSFVRGIGKSFKGDALLRAIVGMAHELGLKTVAEGVETAEQLEFLTSCDCDYIQGYYFSRPLPEADFKRLLDADTVHWSEVQ